jgi:hypothetical protein
VPGSLRRPKLPQSFGFDLTNPFPRNVELLPYFLERVFSLTPDSEAQSDYFLLFRRESLQNIGGLVTNIRIDYRIYRRTDPAILDEVAQRGFSIATNRRFKRYGIA